MNGLQWGGSERGEKPTRKEEVVLLKLSEWSACFAGKYNFSNNFRLTECLPRISKRSISFLRAINSKTRDTKF